MKGIQYLLQATSKLADALELRVVGQIMCNREKLFAATSANTEYTGQVPHIEVRRHFEWADVLCLPSLSDSFGMVCLEAMAARVPIIATPNTGASEIIRDGWEGYVVPIRNAEAIADKLEILTRDRKLLAEMSRNARQRAEEYDWRRYEARLVNAISEFFVRL
jgi:glycosyltransferase involved in cell wall biosynthesis